MRVIFSLSLQTAAVRSRLVLLVGARKQRQVPHPDPLPGEREKASPASFGGGSNQMRGLALPKF